MALSTAETLAALNGLEIPSERNRDVSYRLERCIGEGGTGVAFFALRKAPEGLAPVVMKIVRPSLVANAGATATMIVQKEAVALGRLNERVPPTPFVVRLIDAGAAAIFGPERPSLPWLAIEYVHGGVEGTTLEDRVFYSCDNLNRAFQPDRVAHLVRCIASGLAAIHGVGVIHRDLTPGNVLCCGFGEAEIFKISDFGIARPQGLRSTFGNVRLGTPGYTAPEQVLREGGEVSPQSDIFSFGCLLYFVLTGERLFDGTTPVDSAIQMRRAERRSIMESQWLVPELRERDQACHAIDRAIARCTAPEPRLRFDAAQEFAASVVPWLTETEEPPRPSRALVNSVLNIASPSDAGAWTWDVLHPPGGDRIIQSAAWDVDGHCLATTTSGPAFWDGHQWLEQMSDAVRWPRGIQFARRIDAGNWLVGGAGGTLAVCSSEGVGETVRCPDENAFFLHASGRFNDLLTAVSHQPGQTPVLWAMAAHRWMRPLPLTGVIYVASLMRLDDDRWLICGRLEKGGGFCAIYSPMRWETRYLPVPETRALVAACSQLDRHTALAVGSSGITLRVVDEAPMYSVVDGQPDLTACAVDVLDREWVAGAGALWVRDPEREQRFSQVWQDSSWAVPFISVLADAGFVVAMTVDGAILEGRAAWRTSRQPTAGSSAAS